MFSVSFYLILIYLLRSVKIIFSQLLVFRI